MNMHWRAHNPWTDDKIADLRRLIERGMSGAAIANELGVTRNAAIGKATRLGLSVGNSNKSSNGKTPRQRPHQPRLHKIAEKLEKPDPTIAKAVDAEPIPAPFLGVPLLELQPHHCRYPRTIEGQHFFCGQPRIADSSYCSPCHLRCHSWQKREAA